MKGDAYHKLTPMTKIYLQWESRPSTAKFIGGIIFGTFLGYGVLMLKIAIALFFVSQFGLIFGSIFVGTLSSILHLIITYPQFKMEQKFFEKEGKS